MSLWIFKWISCIVISDDVGVKSDIASGGIAEACKGMISAETMYASQKECRSILEQMRDDSTFAGDEQFVSVTGFNFELKKGSTINVS